MSTTVGQPAPPFEMAVARPEDNLSTLGASATLADYAGRWLVLFFYPLDFSSVCPTEVMSMSDRYEEFVELGAEVLGVSTDSVYSHLVWTQLPRGRGGVGRLNYSLASDMTREVSRSYGVLLEEKGFALRGIFIIDPEGVLQYSAVNNVNVGRSSDEILRVLQALQTGGFCPADWRPGLEILSV